MSTPPAPTATGGRGRRPLPLPHPEWGPEDLVRRAGELVPVLRARSARCEAEGRLLEESNDEFLEAGFYRVLQPRAFGGYEFGLRTFVEMVLEIARGCPSSGWVLALTAGHAVMLSAFYPEQAQVEVYGEDGDFRGPSSTPPRVVAVPVSGGYRISGSWDYASGIDVSTHFFGGITIPTDGAGGPGHEPRLALLQRRDYEIVDNWNVFGLRGTGSRRVVVEDLFVPDHRVIPPPRDAFNARNAPGRSVHPNPLYRAGRLGCLLLAEMCAVAVGVAKGMLDVYRTEAAGRPQGRDPSQRAAEAPDLQRHYGEAWALTHVAEATILHVAERYTDHARRDAEEGIPFSDEQDLELQALDQYATKLAGEAVDLLFRTGGTSSAQTGALRQRYFRAMSVLNTHNGAQYERGAETLGRSHLTGEAPAPVRVARPVPPV